MACYTYVVPCSLHSSKSYVYRSLLLPTQVRTQEKPCDMELDHTKSTDLHECVCMGGRGFRFDFVLGPNYT